MELSKALKIQGMMLEPELAWLAEQASTRKLIAEVGSWKGRGTRALGDNQPEGGIIYAVDTWRGTPSLTATAAEIELYEKELGDKPYWWLFRKFIANTNGLRVTPVLMPSIDAAKCFAEIGKRFDMIFLDAAHDYESVKADILAWRPLLAEGGLFCGHDYHDYKSRFPGVDRAVDESVSNVHALGVGSIWWEG